MLSVAAGDYLKELLDEDTLERTKILNVFMTEELISRKDRFNFEGTTYVIGTLTRNRLLGKKQSRNESFVSNVVYIEMGQLNPLIEAVLAKEDEEDEGDVAEDLDCGDIPDFSVFVGDLELPEDPDDPEDNLDNTTISSQENVPAADSECWSGEDVSLPQTQSVCALGVPLIEVHYIKRKNLNVLTESTVAEPLSYTMAEVQQRVREYFER